MMHDDAGLQAESRLLRAARSHQQARCWAAAEAVYVRIIDEEPQFKAVALHALGVMAFERGRNGTAADLVAKAIKLDGNVAAYYADLAKILERDGGHLTVALDAAKGAVALGDRFPELLARMFHLNLNLDRREEARVVAERFASDPEVLARLDADPAQRGFRGWVRRALGDHAGAGTDLRIALATAPERGAAWYELGRIARASADNAGAVTCYGRALALVGEDLDIVLDQGVALQQLGRTAAATSCFQRATLRRPHAISRGGDIGIPALDDVEVSPARADAIRRRGLETEEAGRRAEAAARYALACSLTPTDERLREDLSRVVAGFGKRQVRFHFLLHSAFGNAAIEPENLLRRAQLGQLADDLLIVYLSGERAANRELLTMLGRHVPLVIDDRLYYSTMEVLLPGFRISQNLLWTMAYENHAHPGTHRTLTFTEADKERGWAGLRRMGVDPERDWFVCAFAREDGWSKNLFPGLTDTFTPFRNADINTYHPAFQSVLDRGGTIIRIGAGMKRPLTMKHPKVIDYAMTHRDEFMDLYLIAHARFLLGTPAGLLDAAALFDTPRLFVNNVPVGFCTWGKKMLHVPKQLVRSATGDRLTIKDYLSVLDGPDAFAATYTEGGLKQHGLAYLDNLPEEILEATEEMLDRLEGRHVDSPEDQALYDRYFALFENVRFEHVRHPARVRLAPALCHLRRHRAWYFPDG
jgi:putative glycosyltransferase (TIGR04372 family)